MGSIKAHCDRITATIRGTIDHLAGASRVVLHPVPDEREDSATTNTLVLHYLAAKNPGLLALQGDDIDQRVRALARSLWNPVTQSLTELAVALGPEVGRVLAARLRSGSFVSNNDATAARKNGRVPGVNTEQLAKALEAATATPEG